MSDLETSMPSRAEILSVIGGLEALSPTRPATAPVAVPSPPPGPLDAAQARHDQDAAALRDMTADRDAWRTAAERLQTELWRQMDVLRTELESYKSASETLCGEVVVLRGDRDGMGTELLRQREQIAHLNSAMTSLLEIASSHEAQPASAPVAAPTAPVAPTAPAAPAAAANTVGYDMPAGMEGRPATQPAPPPVDPNAAPMVIPGLAPDPLPQVRRKPIRAATRTEPVAPPAAAAPEPTAEPVTEPVAEPLPPVVAFTAPEPDGARAEILPSTGAEKKRRLRLG